MKSDVFTKYVNINKIELDLSNSESDEKIHMVERLDHTKLKMFLRKMNVSVFSNIRSDLWRVILNKKYQLDCHRFISDDSEFNDDMVLTNEDFYSWCDSQMLSTYFLNDLGVMTVKKLLNKLYFEYPARTYVPEIWPICCLFLHYYKPSDVYVFLRVMLNSDEYFISTKQDWKCMNMVMPHVSYKKSSNEIKATNWISDVWLLPFEYIIPIFDCFIFEGSKVIRRASTVLYECVLKYNMNEVTTEMLGKPPLTVEKFLKKMFSLRYFSSKRLQKYSDRYSSSSSLEEFGSLLSPMHSAKGSGTVYQHCESHQHCSHILSPEQLISVISSIGDESLCKLHRPVRVYTSDSDGVSFHSLLAKAPESPSILVVRDVSRKCVVGAFLSDHLQQSVEGAFYGRGMTFVFCLKDHQVVSYHWSKKNEINRLNCRFIRVTHDSLEVGGGSDGYHGALHLSNNMRTCSSGPSGTFESPSLINLGDDKIQNSFEIGLVELIGFVEL